MHLLFCLTKRTVLKLLKPYMAILVLPVFLFSCSAQKKAAGTSASHRTNGSPFIENISVSSSGSGKSKQSEPNLPDLKDNYSYQVEIGNMANIEQSLPKQFKYAILLDVDVEELNNQDLLDYIDSWWGTPYRYGGNSTDGIDCSAFTQGLLSAVYNIEIPRIAREQKKHCVSIKSARLQTGDLVFFNTRGGVSHVGIYLCNNKFVHASTSNGVTISDLDDQYWSRKYVGAGRPKGEAVAKD